MKTIGLLLFLLIAALSSWSVVTDSEGKYNVTVLSEEWTATPTKQGGACNGVTSLDAAWVQQYVVGRRQFTPEQMLAGDVTGNGSVTSTDAARIQQYVVKRILRFPAAILCNSDWLFMPEPKDGATLVTPHITDGFCTMGSITWSGSQENVNFKGILIGDVTGNRQECNEGEPVALNLARK